MSEGKLTLKRHPVLPKGRPLLVCIIDGWGERRDNHYNSIAMAKTPCMDALRGEATATNRFRLLRAHGPAVGLPNEDDMGNSEVGHNALGAGRIFVQGAGLVDEALSSGRLFESEGFKYIQEAFVSGGTLHLIGLLSDGGVHSRYDQLIGLIRGSAERGAKKIRVHVLTDGRDVPDGTGQQFVERLEDDLAALGRQRPGLSACIASGGGRMNVTMDRYENDWAVVERGWHAHILGDAPDKFRSAGDALRELRKRDPARVNDQYYPPWVVVDGEGRPVGRVEDGDAVVTFNFRADRMLMLSKALELDNFSAFNRVRVPKFRFAGIMQYDGELMLPKHFLVPPPEIERTSGEYLVANGSRTFVCSETVKFGHVTFFWNGNRSGKLSEELEVYEEIKGDQGIQFNQQPKMRAHEISQSAQAALLSKMYDQVRINLANPDMVGHTGDLKATIEGCEAVDAAIKSVVEAVEAVGGIFLITSDHGNAETMVQLNGHKQPVLRADGQPVPLTSHTTTPVPFLIGGPGLHPSVHLREDLPEAGLANVAATMLNLMGFDAPGDYEPSLLALET